MPRANPAVSFDVAVRHLFRHLDDAAELQRNPLVKHFFASPPEGRTNHQRGVLSLIRSIIDAGAKDYRDGVGLTILYGSIQKKTVKELAKHLGISPRQCYRERAAVYRHVADFIRRTDLAQIQPFSKITSVYGVQMERAALRVNNGDYDRALHEYRSVIDSGDIHQKLAAFSELVALELELGDLAASESSLSELSALLEHSVGDLSETEAGAACARVKLFRARLAWERGAFEEASDRLSLTRATAMALGDGPTENLRALRADVALESANRAFDLGDFASTQAFLAMAKRASSTILGPTPRAANGALIEAILSFVSVRPGGEAAPHDQIALASDALAIASQCGSLKWRLKAELFLMALQRSRVNVLQRGRVILSIAKSLDNPRLFAMLSLELADLLLETPFWRQAIELMSATLPSGNFYAGSFSMLKAVYYLKAGAPSTAREHAEAAHAIARKASAPRFQASTLRILGTASHLQGDDGAAADYILSALPLAERYSSAPACLKAYKSAALITGRRKYARAAETLALAIQ